HPVPADAAQPPLSRRQARQARAPARHPPGGDVSPVQEIQTGHDARGARFALVASRFNETYVRRLVDAALDVLRKRGIRDEDIAVVWVPGSLELPLVAQKLARAGRHDAILAFGVVIRGETYHFELVAHGAQEGLTAVGLE